MLPTNPRTLVDLPVPLLLPPACPLFAASCRSSRGSKGGSLSPGLCLATCRPLFISSVDKSVVQEPVVLCCPCLPRSNLSLSLANIFGNAICVSFLTPTKKNSPEVHDSPASIGI